MPQTPKPSPVPSEPGYLQRLVRLVRVGVLTWLTERDRKAMLAERHRSLFVWWPRKYDNTWYFLERVTIHEEWVELPGHWAGWEFRRVVPNAKLSGPDQGGAA